MKLIDILVRDLPKRGGWPDGSAFITQSPDGRVFCFEVMGEGRQVISPVTPDVADDRAVEIVTRGKYEAALAASKPEWDGDGLPPVGCECEYETNGYGIKRVRVECITMDGIAFTWLGEEPRFRGLDCINTSQAHRFLPIRSEADKKRDAVIESISSILDAGVSTSQDAIDIYDAIAAGKIPGVKLEG